MASLFGYATPGPVPTVGTVLGGQRVTRYIATELASQGLETRLRLTAEFVRRFPMAQLRAAVPKRTGTLARTLELRTAGTRIELWGVFYAGFEPQRLIIQAKFRELARQTFRSMGVIRNV